MAVVQISRIQVRRGQANTGSGLPQLASGEFGWAIDTQKLYIGNGSVAEGAPQVGNTQIITEHDDLFQLADSYIYREGTGVIVTGIDSSNPVRRTLQQRLDDRVSVKAFGVTGNESQDCTSSLQRAIDQLYLNGGTELTANSRVVLHLEAGVYTLTDTIYIPPYTTLVGAGSGKTIIRQTSNNKAVFRTVNDSSTDGNPASDSTSTFNNQARNISLTGLTLQATGASKGLVLQSCRDSHFEDIEIVGTWQTGTLLPLGTDTLEDGIDATNITTNIGLSLNSLSGAVETIRNHFVNCKIKNWAYGIVSNWDINDNTFDTCELVELGYGIVFGKDMTINSDEGIGQKFGPSGNVIQNSIFENVSRQAFYIKEGRNNISHNNRYLSCGNDGGADDQPVYSVIYFNKISNESEKDYFSRTKVLSYSETIGNVTNILGSVPYIPEVEGFCNYTWGFEHSKDLLNGTGITLFRLPQAVNQSFEVDYLMVSQTNNMMRTGTLTIMVNGRTDLANGTPKIEVSDDYNYVGDETFLDSIYLDAILRDIDTDGNFETIVVRSNSTMPSDDNTQFKFKVKNKQTTL